MASSTFYNDIEVKGVVRTTLAGTLMGVVTEMPAAGSKNSGCAVLYEGAETGGHVPGTIYRSNGTTWAAVGKVSPIDNTVTDGSANPVSGDAVHTALQSKQDTLSDAQEKVLSNTSLQSGYFIDRGAFNSTNMRLSMHPTDPEKPNEVDIIAKPGTNITFTQNSTDNISINADLSSCMKVADKPLVAASVTPSWTADSSVSGYSYRGTVTLAGCTTSHMPVVTFDATQSRSGNYCPIAESGSGCVYIWSKVNTSITIPSVVAIKQ